ncbi:hypothetical protein [Olleya marilimosa]|uniref:Uncharacterized protein n=1 Tax=Olleya marilimosa TaxID=272164 RepID=A0ABR8LVL1_9FLAO|nr:hypothetical protein [Olleya marilimosa]MBD3863626.1 hypothetical protein [Olleya marilimosa]MBD3891382.1 hypothetical protein [Olleya marilimosa]
MENKQAITVIDRILKNLDATGINTDTLIDDIKTLRTYTIEVENPLAVKVLRYTYEHIENNDSFLIPIPEDTPLDDEAFEDETIETVETESDPVESLKYVISLIRNLDNSSNISDLKYYKKALVEF